MSNLDTRWLQTASKRSGGNAARRQGTPKRSSDCGVVEFWAAGKDIDGRVGMFGPGVDRDVGFFDDHHAAHAEWAEIMKERFDDRAAALAHCAAK